MQYGTSHLPMTPTTSLIGGHWKEGATTPPRASRWSKRCLIITGGILLALAIGLGVGLGVGLTRSKSGSGTSPSSTPTTPSSNYTSNGTLWTPTAGTTWQIELSYELNDTSYDVSVYDIDLFGNDASIVKNLHKSNRKVICYFSAGSYENFRPDAGKFLKSDYGNELDGWDGEWWLNTSSTNVRNIMESRLDLAQSMGCDGVDPDNIDGYDNDTGFNLTEQGSIDYIGFLADKAHSRNLAIGLKNAGDIIAEVIDLMQWVVNEQCIEYDECDLFQPFIEANKPVFHIEYPSGAPDVSISVVDNVCNSSVITGFSTLLKDMDLDNWVEFCS
jgi:endo-alpha-1,4-polygalactosaminidase (GH114 family)